MTATDLISPFAGLSAALPIDGTAADRVPAELESPFGMGLLAEERPDGGAAELFDQLLDEDFTDALEALVDEAAAQQLAESGSWSARPPAAEAKLALEQWIEPLAAAAERSVERLGERLAEADPLTLGARGLGELLGSVEPEQMGVEGFDNFLGGFLNKAKTAVGGLVRKGLAVAGKLMPVGLLLDKLKALVRPLLDRVLGAALNKLPESVRPLARTLAVKLGIAQAEQLDTDPVTRLAEDLDLQIAGLLAGAAAEPELEDEGGSAVAGLDAARERLASQLTEVPAGTPPVAELEQFIPAVLAARPLVKLGMSMVGRDRVVRFLADRIAGLIKGMVGPEAAGTIARPLVDVGLRTLGFEVPAAEQGPAAQTLAGEALASTVEGTVLRLLELPAEAFADELQLDAAVQQAFAESAAAAMPDRLLRADLPERETAQEGAVWVLMPRSARPAYRYRRYAQVFAVPVTRRLARAIPWSDGGTLESYLLDAGGEGWPVQTEVELYEAIPGTRLGHLGASPGEVQPLTPEVAGLLLGEPGLGRPGMGQPGLGQPGGRPGLGRPALAGSPGTRPVPGARFYRIRPRGLRDHRVRRPRRRVLVHFDMASATPSLCVALRLSERKAQQLLARLDATPRDLPGALTALKRHYTDALPGIVVDRLLRRSLVPDAGAARAIADRVGAAVTAALSAFLTDSVAQLTTAVRDPADGVTITVTFPGVTRAGLDADLPAGQVTVEPGWRHRG
jgi:hypothetical protein